jgi:polysaccharide biosynthesis protein PelB
MILSRMTSWLSCLVAIPVSAAMGGTLEQAVTEPWPVADVTPDTTVEAPFAMPAKAAAARSAVKPPTDRLRPFDDEDYTLAFDSLLGAGDLQRAFLIAQKAVQSVPGDRVWRHKLAKVSMWVQRPEVGAEQWLYLFQQGDHSAETVANLIQLAPLINQPWVALKAWTFYVQQNIPTPTQWQDIYDLYETAVQPAQGSQFFEAQFQRTRDPLLLDYAARLAEHAGDDARAERLYMQRADLSPFSLNSVLRAVVFQIRQDRLASALTLLKAHQSEVPSDAADYWRMFGELAWALRDYDTASQGYDRYVRLNSAVAADWSRLVFLLRREHPEQAADLALQAYQRFGSVDQLLLALDIYAELGDIPAQLRLFASLGKQAEILAGQNTRFLVLRAQFYQKQKKTDLAWADLKRALKLTPQDPDLVLTSLWLLIDANRVSALPGFLSTYVGMASAEARLWPAYGAANQLLERHRDAVQWYRKMIAANTLNPLMLLNYADALERTAQTGLADRVRRHAWLQLKSSVKDPLALLQSGQTSDQLFALARLSLMNQPGDPGMALVRQLVSQLRGVPEAQQDERTLALVLGWALLKEQHGNAQLWMWRSYARQAQREVPLWGQAQVSLQQGDTLTMNPLLGQHAQALPIYNRYDIAYALGDVQQAQDIAFQGMMVQDDESLYDRYRQHVPLQSNYIQIENWVAHGSLLNDHGLRIETGLRITPELQLVLSGSHTQQASDDPVLGALAPSVDRLAKAELFWQNAHGQTSMGLYGHDELAGVSGWHLGQTYQWGGRLSLDANLDYRAPSLISEPMRVAGYENTLSGSLNYNLGRREYLRMAPRFSRYYTQFGDDLGRGQALELEAGYRFKLEYPDWRARIYTNRQNFSAAAGLDAQAQARLPLAVQTAISSGEIDPITYFIPSSSSSWGACLSMGDNIGGQSLQATYSRAWRPFLDVCLNHNDLTSSSVSGVLGVAGSVTGEDQLRLQLESSDSSTTGGTTTNTLSVRYRHYF